MTSVSRVLCHFMTKLPVKFRIFPTPMLIPSFSTRYGLSKIIKSILSTESQNPLDFTIQQVLLRTNIHNLINAQQISTETQLNIEYINCFIPPSRNHVWLQKDWVSCVAGACLEDTYFVASGCYDGKLHISHTGTSVSKLKAHEGAVTAIALYKSSTHFYIVSVGKDCAALLWEVDSGKNDCKLQTRMAVSDSALQTVAISPSGHSLAFGGWDCKIYFHSVPSPSSQNTSITAHPEIASSSVVSITGNYTQCITGLSWPLEETLFNSSMDSLRKWDVKKSSSPTCVQTLMTSRAVTCISVCPSSEGHLVAYGCTDKMLRLWDCRVRSTEENTAITFFSPHKSWLSAVDWSKNRDHQLASGSFDGTIKIWDDRSTVPLFTIKKAHDGKVMAISWFAKAILASGGTDCNLKIHEFPSELPSTTPRIFSD